MDPKYTLESSDDSNISQQPLDLQDNEDKPLKIIPFDDLKITTCTCMWKLRGQVHITDLFWILPITRVLVVMPKRVLKKIRIPYYGSAGAILSSRYAGYTRGLIRSTRTTYFSHSITIDFSTSKKSISVKLAPQLIHMCGASSNEDAQEGVRLIMNHLTSIQELLDYIGDHQQETKEALDWILFNVKGAKVRRPKIEVIKTLYHEITIHSEIEDNIVIRSCFLSKPPETLDIRLVNFFVQQVDDFQFFSELKVKLEWSMTIKRVYSQDLALTEFRKVMVNYNFELGHRIDRYMFASMINGKSGIHSRYDNMANHNVTIEIPLSEEEIKGDLINSNRLSREMILGLRDLKITTDANQLIDPPKRGKSGKNKKQITIMIYRTGKITYSGPNENLMRKYYQIFMEEISKIWPYIQVD